MSQPADPVQRLMDGRAWEEFCDTLKAAGAVVLAPSTPLDPLERADFWRDASGGKFRRCVHFAPSGPAEKSGKRRTSSP